MMNFSILLTFQPLNCEERSFSHIDRLFRDLNSRLIVELVSLVISFGVCLNLIGASVGFRINKSCLIPQSVRSSIVTSNMHFLLFTGNALYAQLRVQFYVRTPQRTDM
jgi:hypothetical protein